MTESFDSAFSGGAKGFAYRAVDDNGQPNPYFVPQGQPHGGKVVSVQVGIPVTEYSGINKGQPKFWDQAKTRPMLQKVITVDTRAGKYPCPPAGPQDDGIRSVYVRDSSDLDKAIRKALQANPGLTVGSEYYQVWTGDRPSKGGGNPAHMFEAMHVPPAVQAQDSFFGDGAGQAATTPAPAASQPPTGWGQQSAPAQQPAATVSPWQGTQAGIPQPAAQQPPTGWGQQSAPAQQPAAAVPPWNPQGPAPEQPAAQQPTASPWTGGQTWQ
jgi:hypothetical protein